MQLTFGVICFIVIVSVANVTEGNINLRLSNNIPNFNFYLNRAKNAIENITSSAFGPNSPINNLEKAVLDLQTVITSVTPDAAAIAVNASIKVFQEFINQARIATNGSTNLAVRDCISTALTSFNNIAPQAINNAVSCSVNIGKDAASLSIQASTFGTSMKTDLALAGTKALVKCSLSVLSLDNVIEKCFDSAVTEVENYFKSQINKINKAIATADSLTVEAGRCISAGADFADKSGQAVVTELRACLNGQGVSVQTRNNTAELNAGKVAVEEVAAILNGLVKHVSPATLNADLSDKFNTSINVENLISGSLESAQSTVKSLEAQLKSNKNPAAKACVNSAKSRLDSLRTSAVAVSTSCVKTNKDITFSLAEQIAGQLLTIKENLVNAGVNAEQKCSFSITANSTQQCFSDVQHNLKANVEKAVKDAQTVSKNAQLMINEAVDCVNAEVARLNTSVDRELSSLTSCLVAQGVKLTKYRY